MRRNLQDDLRAVSQACEVLTSIQPVSRSHLPRDIPARGVHVFSEGRKDIYVGRSDRLRARILEHGAAGSPRTVAALAFQLALEATGNTRRAYTALRGRGVLAQQPDVQEAFLEAKERVRRMGIRWVEEGDPIRQALLEICAAVSLNVRYSRFENT